MERNTITFVTTKDTIRLACGTTIRFGAVGMFCVSTQTIAFRESDICWAAPGSGTRQFMKSELDEHLESFKFDKGL